MSSLVAARVDIKRHLQIHADCLGDLTFPVKYSDNSLDPQVLYKYAVCGHSGFPLVFYRWQLVKRPACESLQARPCLLTSDQALATGEGYHGAIIRTKLQTGVGNFPAVFLTSLV